MQLLALLLLPFLTLFVEANVQVQTRNGLVAGTNIPVNGRTISRFTGIPFAQPPIGSLRFKRPEPVQSWSGVLDAAKPKPLCVQAPMSWMLNYAQYWISDPFYKEYFQLAKSATSSEDCLYLDIYAPYGSKNKTVMLFVHGGGFIMGGSRFYDGSQLASRGDVVVVAIQYRLGIFGFLKGDKDNAPGNVGLWDQVEAMKWVNENIEAFGGDPNKVTIFGESAGAMSVGFQVITEHASKYYQKAIMQSGSSMSVYLATNEEAANRKFARFVKETKCPTGSNGEATANTFDCIQKMSTNKIFGISTSGPFKTLWPSFFPIIDEQSGSNCFFCRKVFNFKDQPVPLQNKSYLIGTNSNEGAMFVNLQTIWPMVAPMFMGFPPLLTFSQLKFFIPSDRADLNFLMSDRFYSGVNKLMPSQVRERLVSLVGDVVFTCADKLLLDHATKDLKNSFNGTFHYYRLDYEVSKVIWNRKWIRGAVHSDDLPLVFGFPLKYRSYSQKDKLVSQKMIEIWTNFAKNGQPMPNEGSIQGFEPIKANNWSHLMIGRDASFKGVQGFPNNLCDLLTADAFKVFAYLVIGN